MTWLKRSFFFLYYTTEIACLKRCVLIVFIFLGVITRITQKVNMSNLTVYGVCDLSNFKNKCKLFYKWIL